jgi:hypothetical protein
MRTKPQAIGALKQMSRSSALHLALCLVLLAPPAHAATLHVSPSGSDAGSGAPARPFQSIQKALAAARPGDVVELASGRYLQDVTTVRDGRPGQPITIKGPSDAVVSGAGAPRVFQVHHDHIALHGFTLDGRHAADERRESYRDKLLYVIGTKPRDGVEGLKVFGMTFRNAGGECLRLRYFARRNEIAHSQFEACGVHDYRFKKSGKNGEAIYVGTAPEQLGRGAPDRAIDESNFNWIHHNSMNTQGNECVDIKEGSSGNIVEHNHCTGQLDANSGGLGSRGSGNVFRFNTVVGSVGAGVRLGGDGAGDGINNDVYGNTLRNNGNGGIRAQRGPQRKICENILEDNKFGAALGEFGKDYLDPGVSCDAPTAVEPGRAAAKIAAQKQADEDQKDVEAATAEPKPASISAPKVAKPAPASNPASITRVEERLRELGYTEWKRIELKERDRYAEVGSARSKDGKKYDLRLLVDTLAVVRIEDD